MKKPFGLLVVSVFVCYFFFGGQTAIPTSHAFGVIWADGLCCVDCQQKEEMQEKFLAVEAREADAYAALARERAEVERLHTENACLIEDNAKQAELVDSLTENFFGMGRAYQECFSAFGETVEIISEYNVFPIGGMR